ncbi:MAG TPA: hypothetical protein VNK23_11590, partial [Candidatus Dormibacteraeota bacterium]|nr:hypothetical protein [Candidatus Dormibacteraeota bacterium]
MASVSFSLTAVVQDAFQVTDPAPQQEANNVTPVNANHAQGAPAPADTVTLTNQTAEGQQTGADPNRSHFDRAAFLGAAAAYIGTNAARPNRQAPVPPLPLLPPLRQTQTAPAAPATTAANTPATTAANTAANTANTANAAAKTANAAAAGDPAASSSVNANAPQQ